jgi:hypothetical protein
MISIMETSHTIDVMTLDATHRRALEDVIGVQLQANQRLIIGVTEIDVVASEGTPRRAQTIEDWTKVYEGMSDEQIEEIDRIAKTRADLTRNLP